LLGFFARLDGDDQITLDRQELSEARFVKREEIDVDWDDVSLTNEMIIKFKQGKTESL
jgi:NAD+ diphosphatase